MSTRAVNVMVIKCDAPDEFFTPNWDDISPEGQAAIKQQGSLPCSGGGVPGTWCRDCRWCGGMDYNEGLAEEASDEFVDREEPTP